METFNIEINSLFAIILGTPKDPRKTKKIIMI